MVKCLLLLHCGMYPRFAYRFCLATNVHVFVRLITLKNKLFT